MKYFKFKNPKIENFTLCQVDKDNDYKLTTLDEDGALVHGFSSKPYKEVCSELLNDGYSVEEINLDDYERNLEYLKYKSCVINGGFNKEVSHG